MYRIFFNNRYISLMSSGLAFPKPAGSVCPEGEGEGEPHAYYLDTADKLGHIPLFFERHPDIRALHLYAKDMVSCFEGLCSAFDMVHAGGGIVRNEKGECLLIYRNDKWDLPKGKQEPGEDVAACALREVEEECGVGDLTLGPLHAVTYHGYRYEGRLMLKRTCWYDMQASSSCVLRPQREENIQRVCWVPFEQVRGYLAQSYASLRSIF